MRKKIHRPTLIPRGVTRLVERVYMKHRNAQYAEALDGTTDPVAVVAAFLKLLSLPGVKEIADTGLTLEEKRAIATFSPDKEVRYKSGVKELERAQELHSWDEVTK
jgi:hypothetical protein